MSNSDQLSSPTRTMMLPSVEFDVLTVEVPNAAVVSLPADCP